jgi:multisubunit Na+/H+ antiporter MnhB subunit
MAERSARAARLARAGAALVLAPLAALLAGAVLALPPDAPGLGDEVAGAIGRSGVSHPVSAVLLDFRGYDTWLELGVLLVAAVALLAIRRAPDLRAAPAEPSTDPVLDWLTRLAVPGMVLAAGYLLWRGSHAPGGAFQAGAVLAAAGVLLLLAGRRSVAGLSPLPLRLLLAAGFLAFLAAGAAGGLAGGAFLQYPPPVATAVILAVESAAAVSIGATLAALFAGAR